MVIRAKAKPTIVSFMVVLVKPDVKPKLFTIAAISTVPGMTLFLTSTAPQTSSFTDCATQNISASPETMEIHANFFWGGHSESEIILTKTNSPNVVNSVKALEIFLEPSLQD